MIVMYRKDEDTTFHPGSTHDVMYLQDVEKRSCNNYVSQYVPTEKSDWGLLFRSYSGFLKLVISRNQKASSR